jgi:hypothetical protein
LGPLQFEVDLKGKDRHEALMRFVRGTIGVKKVQNLNSTELRMKVATKTLSIRQFRKDKGTNKRLNYYDFRELTFSSQSLFEIQKQFHMCTSL